VSGVATPGSGVQGAAKWVFQIKEEKDFLCSNNFKLLRQINGNSINDYGFLMFVILSGAAIVIAWDGCQKT
jgi:hypothetical protein